MFDAIFNILYTLEIWKTLKNNNLFDNKII